MHLKQLKLSGFKSFVEPTVVPFSSQLIAVVGPNGCGKSNIIDAVRWVMGESSARNLRGESMADVIFNGSSTRKSVGQASVELIFDNSMGRLVGQYASYQEIAVKRLVTRDGDSFYFLNGSRCRRRDITDIFLGTGAGARSYSIIGQDTISRLIEAHPEDLRVYLEEAAGVSKYKERRRETLQRIEHTRTNLARVADVRDELEKHLQRLERQAQAARRYKSLKEEERLCKAEILVLKWRALTSEQTRISVELSQLSLQEESYQARISTLIKEISALQEKLHVAQANFQQTQLTFYQLNTEIARLEEMIQQQQREQQRIITDKQQIETELQTTTQQLQRNKEELDLCEQQLIISQADVQSLHSELQECQQALHDQEQQKIGWDKTWQHSQAALNQVKRESEVIHVQLQHIKQQHQQLQVRLEKNQSDQTLIIIDPLADELFALKTQQTQLAEQAQRDVDNYQHKVEEGQILRQQLTTIEQQLHQAHDIVQALTVEQAALTATLNAKLRNEQQEAILPQWNQRPRLAEVLTLPEQWLRAGELVLGEGLQAIVVDSLDEVWPTLIEFKGGTTLFVQPQETDVNQTSYPRLADMISGILPCWISGLDQIFAAENLKQAIEWLPTLNQHQSVVTADGYWLGPGWVKVDRHLNQDEPGLLFHQQALTKLKNALLLAEKKLNTLQANRDQLQAQRAENTREQNELQQTMILSQDALRSHETQIHNKQQAHQHAVMRRTVLTEEYQELLCSLEELATQIIQMEDKWQDSALAVKQQEQELTQITSEMGNLNDVLIAARRARDEKSEIKHQAELRYKGETLKVQQLRDNMHREQQRIDGLNERFNALVKHSNELTTPNTALKESLHEKVTLHQQLESQLSIEHQLTDDIQKQLTDSELASKHEEQQVKMVQQQLQQARLHEQGLTVRAQGLLESLSELNIDAETLLAGISEAIDVDKEGRYPEHSEGAPVIQEISSQARQDEILWKRREQTLAVLDEKIKRLGAINLVAIEEYQTESERKQHLDEQYSDLTEALLTLEAAIGKMDKETQLRLKDTFDQVNVAFQSLFPRLFGGGRAFLELTCDNLLEAGILVMAQPPGKRNSTIHLLSGGEKAMTAVALVFAIFQLNPSPFCMLDEVDAPLDDLNIRRFCDLVKEMSHLVQFMFITHNKVTMEMADHLIGVTMREPGVSRVVTVDVEAAVKMQTNE